MIYKLIHLFFRRRHFWRDASFDEIAELYVSRLLTMFAHNAIVMFSAVYMYQLGYSLLFIVGFYLAVYFVKLPMTFVAGHLTAKWGPKHAILISNLLRIPALGMFAFVEQLGIVSIVVFGVLQGIAVVCYNIGYTVDFSKVKDGDHVGKEIGVMQIIERIARVVAPLVGGVVAAFVSPVATVVGACMLFAVATKPLLRTVEPTMTHTPVGYRRLPWRLVWRTLVAQWAYGVDFVTSGIVWTMFAAAIVFANTGEVVYAALGGLASLGVFASIVMSYMFGRMIDRHRSSGLLVFGAVGNMVIHLFRPLSLTPASVVGVNIASETATSAYAMALMRVQFDTADLSGARIAYLTLCEAAAIVGGISVFALWAGLLWVTTVPTAFAGVFLAASAAVLLLVVARHYARRPHRGILGTLSNGGKHS